MRKQGSLLALVALTAMMTVVPVVAHGEEEPPGECPNARWELTAVNAVDGSVAGKAARKDARGNNDGFVCQKQNKKGRFQVKDNRVEDAEGPTADGCPAGDWLLMDLEAVHDSVKDKAARKDARGNNDGLVCQKENRAGRFQVKDNNAGPTETEEPEDEPEEEPEDEAEGETA